MYQFKGFAPKAGKALWEAIRLAEEMGHTYIGTEHIVGGLLRTEDSIAAMLLHSLGIRQTEWEKMIGELEGRGNPCALTPADFSPRAKGLLDSAKQNARCRAGASAAGTEDLLTALAQDPACVGMRLLSARQVTASMLLAKLTVEPAERIGEKSKKSSALEQYGRDLTARAAEGRLDPVVGREKEIERTVQILCRRTKNNPCLIGEPGVGKTAIAEGLAQRIADGCVPEELRGKRLISVDLTGMVAGTKYRGDFEERVRQLIYETTTSGDVLLFVDEMHTLIGAGAADGAVDAANILKPALARGELQLIGATTLSEFRRHVEKDAALERRFQSVTVEEPSPETTLDILKGLRPHYEQFHGVLLPDDALQAAVTLSVRYVADRFLPDKAVDIMDEAAAKVKLNNFTDAKEEWYSSSLPHVAVTVADMATVVSAWTGIPVGQLTETESERLLRLEEALSRRLVGQEQAVKAVARAVRRGRAGLQEPDRPIGSFLFLGPSGVGKTELTKALAEVLFGDEHSLIRLDMSEYMEKHTVARLIGSPPGYVGYEEAGQLTEKLRRRPYTVVLLDEIEKAHPDVCNLLLQILDDGQLTDAQGRTVSFRNAVIVMTSNVGAAKAGLTHPLGFAETAESKKRGYIMEELKKTFRPELLGRIDEIITFDPLTPSQTAEITRRLLVGLRSRLADKELSLSVSEEAIAAIAAAGTDPLYGARPLRREIRTRIEDPLAERLLTGQYGAGDTVFLDFQGGDFCFSPQIAPASH